MGPAIPSDEWHLYAPRAGHVWLDPSHSNHPIQGAQVARRRKLLLPRRPAAASYILCLLCQSIRSEHPTRARLLCPTTGAAPAAPIIATTPTATTLIAIDLPF